MANNDYSGEVLTMESFTAQTTNGSGDITVTLQNTPVADDAIMVNLQGVAGAFAQLQTRTGTSATFRVYQKYDRTDTTAGGTVTDLPTSVTTDTTTGGPSFTTGGSGSTTDASTGSRSFAPANHTHGVQISKISNHNHENTATILTALASTGSITLVVAYAF